jgi:hypothetical protein
VHQFDTGQKDALAVEVLEAEHRPGSAFDGPMVLLDDVIQILSLSNLDGYLTIVVDRVDGSQIGAALVDSDCLILPAPLYRNYGLSKNWVWK